NVALNSPIEQSRFRGECTVKLRVTNCEGIVLEGAPYEFTFFDTNTIKTISVARGKTSKSGEIILQNVKNGTNALRLVAKINGVEFPMRFDQVSTNENRDLLLPPGPGDSAPKFEVKELALGAAKTYPNGRYAILDFWAVWCGACQEPMAALNDTLSRKAAAWSNRVDVIAVNLDDSKDDVTRRIKEKGWRGFPNYWEPRGFESDLAKLYQIVQLPTSLLIGPDGRILWRGDPRELDFEQLIDNLLAGRAKADELISWHRNN
ncbi:MAG TPA: thioredoxin-like domain-containing protein, partial [Pirellula sp.]|nr:thioredoxin-like domain-containing protein [Pirellula sp.]